MALGRCRHVHPSVNRLAATQSGDQEHAGNGLMRLANLPPAGWLGTLGRLGRLGRLGMLGVLQDPQLQGVAVEATSKPRDPAQQPVTQGGDPGVQQGIAPFPLGAPPAAPPAAPQAIAAMPAAAAAAPAASSGKAPCPYAHVACVFPSNATGPNIFAAATPEAV